MGYLPKMLLLSLLITIAVELPLSLLFGARKKGLIAVLLVNLITNPAVVFLSYLARGVLSEGWTKAAVIFLEIAAVITEALLYKKSGTELTGIRRPFPASVTLNLTSFLAGLLFKLLR